MRDRCEYCGALFTPGATADIGVGMLQVDADSPSCECYDDDLCERCGEDMLTGELLAHECYEEETGYGEE